MRYCLACGRPPPLHARADRRYCSTRCRVLAFRQRHASVINHTEVDYGLLLEAA